MQWASPTYFTLPSFPLRERAAARMVRVWVVILLLLLPPPPLVFPMLGALAQLSCTTYAANLGACFPYVQNGNTTKLGSDCCSPLKQIVADRPDCLCTLQSLSTSVPNVNLTRASQLNTLCDIKSNASLSSCDGSPAASPTHNHGGLMPLQRLSVFDVIFMALIFSLFLFY